MGVRDIHNVVLKIKVIKLLCLLALKSEWHCIIRKTNDELANYNLLNFNG